MTTPISEDSSREATSPPFSQRWRGAVQAGLTGLVETQAKTWQSLIVGSLAERCETLERILAIVQKQQKSWVVLRRT
jgi:hypothetical protein